MFEVDVFFTILCIHEVIATWLAFITRFICHTNRFPPKCEACVKFVYMTTSVACDWAVVCPEMRRDNKIG